MWEAPLRLKQKPRTPALSLLGGVAGAASGAPSAAARGPHGAAGNPVRPGPRPPRRGAGPGLLRGGRLLLAADHPGAGPVDVCRGPGRGHCWGFGCVDFREKEVSHETNQRLPGSALSCTGCRVFMEIAPSGQLPIKLNYQENCM